MARDPLLSRMSQTFQCMIRSACIHLSTVSFLMRTSTGFHKVLIFNKFNINRDDNELDIKLILWHHCSETCLMWLVYTNVINYLLT